MKFHASPSSTRVRMVENKTWLNLLADPKTEIELDLQGLQGRFEPGPGWDTETRKIGQHLVYFISGGQCAATVHGKRMLPMAGSLSWIFPGTMFRFFSGAGGRLPVVYRFRFSVARGETAYAPAGHFRFAPQAWPVFELMRQLVLEAERPGMFSRWRKQSLVSLLSMEAFVARTAARREILLDDGQRMAISAFVAEKPMEKHTPAGLARHLGLSHDYFSRIFRRSYGASPRTWLLKQKLAHAAVLLRESRERISEIAERLGYGELYLFSRQFRQVYGVSPRQWRQGRMALR